MMAGAAPTPTPTVTTTPQYCQCRMRQRINNKLLATASAVTLTAWMIKKPLCLSFSISSYYSQSKRRYYHPNQFQSKMCWRNAIAPSSMINNFAGGGGEVDPARKRWRRRRKVDDSILPIISTTDDGAIASDDDENSVREDAASSTTTTSPFTSQCPIYSMKFPRYRISLTNDSTKNLESEQRRTRRLRRGFITKLLVPSGAPEGGRDNNNHPLGLFTRILNPSDVILDPSSKNDGRLRRTVESFYREEKLQGRFRWITSSTSSGITTSSTTTKTTSSTVMNTPDEDFHAASSFWRMASDVISYYATKEYYVDGDAVWYLALPETTSTVAQNLCDTLNWYADYILSEHDKEDREDKELPCLLLRAEMDTRVNNGKIPIVRFTPQHNHAISQWQEQLAFQNERKLLLTNSNDTERRTKAWVKRVLVQLGICPFTKSEIKSGQGLRDLGVPVANIMYRHSSALGGSGGDSSRGRKSSEGVYLLMADAWEAISDMVAAGPTGVSSILLSAPGFDDDFEFWAGPIFAMLETCVGAIQAEEMIGVVCFHPKYVTPDGKSWPGFGHMHSVPRLKQWYTQYTTIPLSSQSLSDNEIAAGGAWQRRTPHSVINVLRAEQLEAAEGRRRTGELYGRNIRVLVGSEEGVGLEKLTEDLKREQSM